MKPIPPGHSEAADNAPIPGRPWWRYDGGEWIRRGPEPGLSLHRSFPAMDVAAAAARFDAAHPLPHPGYRAGQVWLHQDGVTTTVIRALAGDAYGFTTYGHVGTLSLSACFLLHDPLMPSRAPWGPA